LAIPIGKSIGRYHILERLGEGGMATVFKALDMQLEREVAIKLIRAETLGGANAEVSYKRFKREARLLAKLSHPNILKLLDYGEFEGQLFLVTNYIPGGSLRAKLGKPLPWHEAVHLLLPIARALEYAHEQGMIHRDVKPSNILLTSSGIPILADFGIAKVLKDETGGAAGQAASADAGTSTDTDLVQLTRTDVGIGTPEYMAPEQGRGHADRRSDIYSLGVVFYEMVTGRKPFIADTPLAVLLMHITDPLPSPLKFIPDLPVEIERIIIKALAKRPEDRYQNMTVFIGAVSQRLSSYDEKLRSLASSLEKEEKWQEALLAWRAVLALEPEDRPAIEAKIERIQLWQELTVEYNDARQALAEKDIDLAIRLLKGIVTRDPAYKDVASLLARLIKSRQSMIDSLEEQEKWDDALNAWRGYLEVEPEKQETIAANIQRIEQKRDLANLYREARLAINKKEHDHAIRLLKEIVARDQSYKDAAALLTQAIKIRQSRAIQLEEAEKWDEALKAWQDYLGIEPEKQDIVAANLRRIERKRDLANLYREARRAMEARDDVLAAKLLKEIIARDETYKDVLQLLGRIAARRSTRHRQISRNRLWLAMGSILVVILLSLGAGYLYARKTGPIRAGLLLPGSGTKAATATSQPGIVLLPTPSPVTATDAPAPGLPEQIRSFADPILAAIANIAPDYQDDFSNPNSGWSNDLSAANNQKGYKDGAYFISNYQAEKGGDCNGASLPSSPVFSDFVLEVDVKSINQGKGAWHIIFRSNDYAHYGVNVSPDGRLWFHKNVNNTHVPLPLTEGPVASFQSGDAANHLTLVAQGNRMAAYINGEPITMFTDTSSIMGTILLGVCSTDPLQVLFDNLKVWDISGLTAVTSPAQIRSFTDPILAAIANKTPDYQDDFSNPQSGWPEGRTPDGNQWGYTEGAYVLTVSPTYRNPSGDPCVDFPFNNQPQFKDAILEFDAQFVSGKGNNWHTIFRQTSGSLPAIYVIGFNLGGEYNFSKSLGDQSIFSKQWPAPASLLPGTDSNHVTMVMQGNRVAIYINKKPLLLVTDEAWQDGRTSLNLGACNNPDADTSLKVRFDNLKVWDITNPSQ
jgi:serine/threonine protein kinase